jgi:dTDP-4-dehydrorhamnose reductase
MRLWGGIECTLNRVGDRYFDQLDRSGHYARGDDLERMAALGLRVLRYPLLWERAATASPTELDWSFADDRLPRLRALGITPIAGLVHHGSGPRHASLESAEFAPGLADYAARVAQRFPWLEWYTPVNEPLTTARFAGLYGCWHPHERSNQVFARILVNECRATVLAMRAIRAVNPAARLVQTDDLGTIFSTPHLHYQAEFENQRRWLGWDLLCGRVDAAHPMYAELVAWGIAERELAWFCENRCPPDIIGIDHYVTSDRFLDERCERYPPAAVGANAFECYADVEAVRVLERPGTSLRHCVLEAAQRYRIPVVLTEVHLGCSEDEQVRWLHEAWTTCEQLAASGVDVRAITAWAMLGCYDWDTLLTRNGPTYESGVFCLRSRTPRATALAEYVRVRAAGGDPHQVPALARALAGEGWWRRPERLIFGDGLPCQSALPAVDLHRLVARPAVLMQP